MNMQITKTPYTEWWEPIGTKAAVSSQTIGLYPRRAVMAVGGSVEERSNPTFAAKMRVELLLRRGGVRSVHGCCLADHRPKHSRVA